LDASKLGASNEAGTMKMRGTFKLLSITSIFLLLAACGAIPIEEEPPMPMITPPPPAQWRTASVYRGDVVADTIIMPVFTSEAQAILHFPESGLEIEDIFITNGDLVEVGQVIAALRNPELDEMIEEARRVQSRLAVQLRQLDERHANSLQLAEITEIPIDDAVYLNSREVILEQMHYRRIEYNFLMERHDSMIVRSPVNGIARNVLQVTDDMLSSAAAVLVIIDDMENSFFRARHTGGGIYPGDRFEMTVVHLALDIEVEAMEPQGEMLGHIWFQVAGGYDLNFESGTLGRIVHVHGQAFDVVVVPTRAIARAGERYSVFVMEDGIRRLRHIEIGVQNSHYTEIISGVEVGELIVI
jgi:hypothetical protein